MKLKIGDNVKIDPHGEFGFQIAKTGGTIGTITGIRPGDPWFRVLFENGYENGYLEQELIKIKLSWKEKMRGK